MIWFFPLLSGKKTNNSSLIVLLLLFLFYGCTRSHPKTTFPIQSVIVDSFYLPFSFGNRLHDGIRYIGNDKISYITNNDYVLHVYNLKIQQEEKTVSLAKYAPLLDCFTQPSEDSIFLQLIDNTIVLLTTGKEIVFNIDPLLKQIDTFTFSGSVTHHLTSYQDTLLISVSTTRNVGLPRVKQYLYQAFIKLNSPKGPVLLDYINLFPESQLTQDYYSLINMIGINGSSLLYTFNHSDTFYIFDNGSSKALPGILSSNYYKPSRPFNYDSSLDYKYTNHYDVSQARMGLLFYQPGTETLFQFMKHGCNPEEEDGTINEYYDCPLSLFVISDDFSKQKEYYIPANFADKLFFSFCSDDFLYIPADASKQHHKKNTLYYRLKFDR